MQDPADAAVELDHPARTPSAGLRRERVLASPQFRDGTFRNTTGARDGVQGGMLPMFGELLLFGGQERRPPAPLPLERPHEAWTKRPSTGFRATWLGHSTVLLELDGRRVLTDPVFAKRVSPVGFIGPRRFHPVPAELAELPPIDVVLLSHDHLDHLCRPTMMALARTGVPVVTALGVGAHLEKYGFTPAQITELDWFEAAEVGGVHFTATPSQHFSGRTLTGRNKTLWASWVIQSERRKVFFSGDTGLTPEFAEIGRRFGPFDLVMLEIGAFHPSWGSIHLGPANALEAFRMLGGGTLLPVHWGTFSLGFHGWNEPGEQLVELAPSYGARILTPRLGAAFEPEHVDGPTPWWREVLSSRARRAALATSAASVR
ncbi:MAG: MBL fold metallo-hydrolase [Myxococcota bacterium]|nr:MBL fold metallo-hydrolase [Myxococcota bacterium]